jgi:hypothetical protein
MKGWPAISLLVLGCSLVASVGQARDRGADGEFDKRESSHFVLYQDVDIDRSSGFHGSRRFENRVLEVLERAYDELDDALGLRPTRRLQVMVYDPGLFDANFAGRFRFSAVGFYNGTIYIRGGTRVDAAMVRTLHHELVHAAFDAEAPSLVLPAWLNEGVAEWFEARAVGKRGLTRHEAGALARVAAQGQLFSLWQLSDPSFVGFGPEAAQLAYLQSYGFIEYLSGRYGDDSIKRLCAELLRKRDLARAVKLAYRADLAELEQRFLADSFGALGSAPAPGGTFGG